jgi:acetyl-CoA/propionyl-CoA carboxylase biotin carboxyl carrier protein
LRIYEIHSMLPGTVSYFHVDEGAKVARGDKVLAVECMKVLYDMDAPAGGVVNLKVNLGDFVEQDQLVARIIAE